MTSCRTPALGGSLYRCSACGNDHRVWHGCGNRHCPSCGGDKGGKWLERHGERLLATSYYMVTFTLPAELRGVARRHPRTVYGLMMKRGWAALCKLAADPRRLGGRLGATAVLHTWARDLSYHPHVHFLVAGGGLDEAGVWHGVRNGYFLPARALASAFRGGLREDLEGAGLLDGVKSKVWRGRWCVDVRETGNGLPAFRYLAPYVFRVAIGNKRIVAVGSRTVTFEWTDAASKATRRREVDGVEFLRLFMLHVLPKGFVKVRSYGLMTANNAHRLQQAREQLSAQDREEHGAQDDNDCRKTTDKPAHPPCPRCGTQMMRMGEIAPPSPAPPARCRAPPQTAAGRPLTIT